MIPETLAPHLGQRVYHLTDYQKKTNQAIKDGCKKFAVIGASQSAVEILIDLYKSQTLIFVPLQEGLVFDKRP
ncbi:hypothetical protein HORIV_46870 [Vreelandella olivaria]|uniref:Uncharacterized protein n=1 Tax=Vreelandella olivaria TaxID=390919 RepID=A0ABM7GNM4_9GAMM|nr:hypothetical protein HORIV_46870 [Halomonas olivaria]